jgi:hypothetical protein
MNTCKYCQAAINWIDRKPFHYEADGTRIDERFGQVVNLVPVAHTYDACSAIRTKRKTDQANARKAKAKAERASNAAFDKDRHEYRQKMFPVGSYIVDDRPSMGSMIARPVGRVLAHIPDSRNRRATGSLKIEFHPSRIKYLNLGLIDKDSSPAFNAHSLRVVSAQEYRRAVSQLLREVYFSTKAMTYHAPAPWAQAFYPKIWEKCGPKKTACQTQAA